MDVMNISEELISFETAKLAKEKGFSVKCNFFFNAGSGWKLQEDSILRQCSDKDIIECPTQSLLQRWLREVHKIHVNIDNWELTRWYFNINDGRTSPVTNIRNNFEFYTYETTLEKGLFEGLKLIK